MCSVQGLRAFVTERLTAAAAEILGAFEKTIAEYEEEIERQRRLLDAVWRPEVKLRRLGELLEQPVSKKSAVATEQQLRNSRLDQEEPDPPQVKEEKEEICISQTGEQLVLKRESDDVMWIPPYEECDHIEQKPVCDHQLLGPSCPGAESSDIDSSARSTEPQLKKKRHESTITSNNTDDSPVPEVQCNSATEKTLSECDFCGKQFTSSFSLKEHLKIHTGQKPHVCEICGKGFSRASTLNIHLRIHSGQNLHLCNICGESFNEWCELRSHMMSHTDEKPYRCNSCGDRFYQLSHLTNHKKIHTRENVHVVKHIGEISGGELRQDVEEPTATVK